MGIGRLALQSQHAKEKIIVVGINDLFSRARFIKVKNMISPMEILID
jgi:glyceraldehyde-3-phosphate dehydrogenase/erythrose-4-phosphate dehydrogenase